MAVFIDAQAQLCETVRAEVSGQITLVGRFSDKIMIAPPQEGQGAAITMLYVVLDLLWRDGDGEAPVFVMDFFNGDHTEQVLDWPPPQGSEIDLVDRFRSTLAYAFLQLPVTDNSRLRVSIRCGGHTFSVGSLKVGYVQPQTAPPSGASELPIKERKQRRSRPALAPLS